MVSNQDWQIILTQPLKTEEVDFKGNLAQLGLVSETGKGITVNAIIQRLIDQNKGTTGSQFMFGIRALGIALANQFTITLMVHLHLASKFGERKNDADPLGMRVCISKIQVSLVTFANKAAFFGHPTQFFNNLNNKINEFLKKNEGNFNKKKRKEKNEFVLVINKFLLDLIEITKKEIKQVSYNIQDLDNDEKIREIMNFVKLATVPPKVIDKKIDKYELYTMIINIDNYEQVNVSSIDLSLGEKIFRIVEYNPKV